MPVVVPDCIGTCEKWMPGSKSLAVTEDGCDLLRLDRLGEAGMSMDAGKSESWCGVRIARRPQSRLRSQSGPFVSSDDAGLRRQPIDESFGPVELLHLNE